MFHSSFTPRTLNNIRIQISRAARWELGLGEWLLSWRLTQKTHTSSGSMRCTAEWAAKENALSPAPSLGIIRSKNIWSSCKMYCISKRRLHVERIGQAYWHFHFQVKCRSPPSHATRYRGASINPPTEGRLAREEFSDIIVIHRSQDNDVMSVQKTAVNRGHSISKWTGWSGGIENAHCSLTDLISETSRMPTGVVQGEEWLDPWGIYSLNLQWMSANHPGAGIVKGGLQTPPPISCLLWLWVRY